MQDWESVLRCKWSVMVLVSLREGMRRPSQILRCHPGLTAKELWERLRRLEQMGLVERMVFEGFPRHTEYRLTSAGQEVALWGQGLLTSGFTFDELTTLLKCRYMVAVLRVLAERSQRPKELQARLKLVDKLLFDRLATLEALSLVQREVLSTRPVEVHYHLTERGRALLPLLKSMPSPRGGK